MHFENKLLLPRVYVEGEKGGNDVFGSVPDVSFCRLTE